MSEERSRFKIRKGEIEIEYEGSPSEVAQRYKEAFEWVKTVTLPPSRPKSELAEKPKKAKKKKKARKKPTRKPTVTVAPIPLDLKQNGEKPALRAFFEKKGRPKTYTEKITIFAYYSKKYLNTKKIEAGHVVSCCKEIRSKVPRNISQMFYNIQQHKGWLDVGEKGEYATITTAGENFVEYDLPRKKNIKKDKVST